MVKENWLITVLGTAYWHPRLLDHLALSFWCTLAIISEVRTGFPTISRPYSAAFGAHHRCRAEKLRVNRSLKRLVEPGEQPPGKYSGARHFRGRSWECAEVFSDSDRCACARFLSSALWSTPSQETGRYDSGGAGQTKRRRDCGRDRADRRALL